jgi:hypothetical protein
VTSAGKTFGTNISVTAENCLKRKQGSKLLPTVMSLTGGDSTKQRNTLEWPPKKRRLEENYKFLPADTLLASDEMGELFCFYLHFSLAITVPEDLDEQPNGVAALIERLRAAYPGDDGETFRAVGVLLLSSNT